MEFTGVVTGGRLSRELERCIDDALRLCEGKTVCVTVKEKKRRRSLNQNCYYFGVVIPPIVEMFQNAGNDCNAEECHQYLKLHVCKLREVVILPDGSTQLMAGSTRKLTTAEMEAYLEKIRAWAAGWGVEIPLPNEGKLYP